jgi:hypothetical protein
VRRPRFEFSLVEEGSWHRLRILPKGGIITAFQMVKGWAVVSAALNLEAVFLFASYPAGVSGCPVFSDCQPVWGPLVGWQLILGVAWIPLLLLARPRAAWLVVGSQSFLLGLVLGLFVSYMFTLALLPLFYGALAGFVLGLLNSLDGSPRSLGKQLTFTSLGWLAAAAVLVLDYAYSASNVGTVSACVFSPGFSSCITYGPYLWPYAQTLAATVFAGGLVSLLMLWRPRFWLAGIIGAVLVMGSLFWFATLSLPSNIFAVGLVGTLGACVILGASSVCIDVWWPRKRFAASA